MRVTIIFIFLYSILCPNLFGQNSYYKVIIDDEARGTFIDFKPLSDSTYILFCDSVNNDIYLEDDNITVNNDAFDLSVWTMDRQGRTTGHIVFCDKLFEKVIQIVVGKDGVYLISLVRPDFGGMRDQVRIRFLDSKAQQLISDTILPFYGLGMVYCYPLKEKGLGLLYKRIHPSDKVQGWPNHIYKAEYVAGKNRFFSSEILTIKGSVLGYSGNECSKYYRIYTEEGRALFETMFNASGKLTNTKSLNRLPEFYSDSGDYYYFDKFFFPKVNWKPPGNQPPRFENVSKLVMKKCDDLNRILDSVVLVPETEMMLFFPEPKAYQTKDSCIIVLASFSIDKKSRVGIWKLSQGLDIIWGNWFDLNYFVNYFFLFEAKDYLQVFLQCNHITEKTERAKSDLISVRISSSGVVISGW